MFSKSTCVGAILCLTAIAQAAPSEPTLRGRAVLGAETYAPGPTSGARLGEAPIHGVQAPFVGLQPIQGFSAIADLGDGTFLTMSDNGFGTLESSADYELRVYRVRPRFATAAGGAGDVQVLSYFRLRDPDRHLPFAITNHFTASRVLTGADLDIESMQRAADGTMWFGDEFGPFLVHTDATGRVLEPPVRLPDPSGVGELRSPQSPISEEASAVRIMNAVARHGELWGAWWQWWGILTGERARPVFSPWESMLGGNSAGVLDRESPPESSGLRAAASNVFDVKALQAAGFDVVTWTVNDSARMAELMVMGVDGIISDRPDLLLAALRAHDADGDGIAGDFIGTDGLVDAARFDAQGHRGARNLRPENTLPAMEAALDNLMTTLETDTGVTLDGIPVLDHEPAVSALRCRRLDGQPYEHDDELLLRDLTLAELQETFVCDRLIRGPSQLNNRALSPVSQVFALWAGLADPYVMPSLEQLFDFVTAYELYYRWGPGRKHADAELRWRNAARVRFNIETKLNPRQELADRTWSPAGMVDPVLTAILDRGLEARADVQSFDFRTLLRAHARAPWIRTVFLFGDFPTAGEGGDGTNLEDEEGENTPWLAGLPWPYRETRRLQPFRVQASGGFEGMAASPCGTLLYPLLEKPTVGGEAGMLLIHEYDTVARAFTGRSWKYPLETRGVAIGDFVLVDADTGLVIERDGTQGDLGGFKAIYRVELGEPGTVVTKHLVVDLMRIADPDAVAGVGGPGDVGIGPVFAFPFVTIEDVVVLDERHILVVNDNNFPFSVGRHVGSDRPDDTEMIIIELPEGLVL